MQMAYFANCILVMSHHVCALCNLPFVHYVTGIFSSRTGSVPFTAFAVQCGVSVTLYASCRVTAFLENLEMSGNLTAVREKSGNEAKVKEMSGKILSGRTVIVNVMFGQHDKTVVELD